MDYFNDIYTTGLYSTTISGEFYAYPIQTSAPGWVEVEVFMTSPPYWSLGGQPNHTTGQQTNLEVWANPSRPPDNQNPAHIFPESTQGRDDLSFPEHHPSTAVQYAEPSHCSAVAQDDQFANTMAHAPGSSKFLP